MTQGVALLEGVAPGPSIFNVTLYPGLELGHTKMLPPS